MESELYKQRSLSRCLNDAYNLYRTNFKTIIRRIWLPSLILSLLTAATYLIYANGLMALASANLSVGSGIALSVLCLLSACAYVWIFTIIISLLNGKSVKANLPRMIRLALAVFGLMIMVCAFIGLVSMAFVGLTKTKPNTVLLTAVLGAAVACVVAYVLALPLSIVR